MTIQIEQAKENDRRVDDFRGIMPSDSRLEIFGGVRWHQVEVIALAIDAGLVVGMATLAPGGEYGETVPKILGIWVRTSSRRQGVGTRLIEWLAQESVSRYHVPALAGPYTREGLALCSCVAKRARVTLKVKDNSEVHDLS